MVPAPTRIASSSEFQATPQLTPAVQAAEPPDLLVEQLGDEDRGREGAVVVLDRADQDLGDREEDESDDQRDDQPDRADHEDVAVDRAAAAIPRVRRNRKAALTRRPP